MGFNILVELLSGLVALAVGEMAIGDIFKKYLPKLFRKKAEPVRSYGDRLSDLTFNLNKSTIEVDKILSELASVAKERAEALTKLEADLSILEKREQEAKKRIEDLQNVPLAAAEHFASLTSSGEKRSARRDYLLFAVGVIASTIIAILLKLLGWG